MSRRRWRHRDEHELGPCALRGAKSGRKRMATDTHKLMKAVEEGEVELAEIDPLAIDGSLARKRDVQTADTAVTREQRRSRRKRAVRARTISVKRMTKRELELG